MPQVKPVACRREVNSLLRALSMAPPTSSPYSSYEAHRAEGGVGEGAARQGVEANVE